MGSWPSFDDLFGNNSPGNGGEYTYSPPNDYAVYSALGKKPTVEDIPWLKENQRTGGTRYDEAASWGYSAPDPEMAPEGMVVNPFAKLPGNNPYISEAEYQGMVANGIVGDGGLSSFVDDTGQLHYVPNYDAYDATRLTAVRNDPSAVTEMGYNPAAPWQRENDYYAALANRNALSIATGGNYVTSKVGREGDTDIFEVRPIPKGYDMRQGEYYQPDGTVGVSDNRYVPTEPLFFGISDAEKKLVPAGMSYLDYVMSQDVSRSQPRANSMGEAGFGIGGVVRKGTEASIEGTPAYDYLRRMTSPDVVYNTAGDTAKDPNPFRGRPGTTTSFTAEASDTVEMYPGVSFYEMTPDGNFRKVTALEAGKEYYGIRESYDYTGFPINTQIQNADKGTNISIRIGDKGSINVADIDKSLSLTGASFRNPLTGEYKFFKADEINDLFGGEIPAGATLLVTKITDNKSTASSKVGIIAGTLRFEDGTPDGVMLGPQDYAKAKSGLPYWNPKVQATVDPKTGKVWVNNGTASGTWISAEEYEAAKKAKEPYWDESIKAYVDPLSHKIWQNEETGWVERKDAVPHTPAAPGSAPTQQQPNPPADTADFNTQMVAYIGGFYGQPGPSGLTYGKSGSIYPDYAADDPTLESFSGDGWVIPIADSTVGASVVDIKKAAGGGKVWVFNPTDKDPNNWDEVKSNTIEPGKRYVIVLSNTAIKDANSKMNKGKK